MSEEKIVILLPAVAREQFPGIWSAAAEYLPAVSEEQLAVVVSLMVDIATQATGMAQMTARVQNVERKHGLQ